MQCVSSPVIWWRTGWRLRRTLRGQSPPTDLLFACAWELSADGNGTLSVTLENQATKERKPEKKEDKKASGKKPPEAKEPFNYPTPQDLSKKDLAPNKPPEQLKAEKEEEKKAKAKAEVEARKKVSKPDEMSSEYTPKVAIRVAAVKPLPLDNAWKHIFFTYDGSGRASGVKIYVNGVQVATRVLKDNLGRSTIRTDAPMQLGWRNPDEHPAKDARYQDIRLYARALSPDEVKRLPFEDYVAEIVTHPAAQWTQDQSHIVTEFYLNNVDSIWRGIKREMAGLDEQLERLSRGGDLTLVSWEKSTLPYAHVLTRGV